jgi:opacity protein-like surface antigen
MKKVMLSSIALISFSFLNAQEIKFGAKAGLNVSTISVEVPQISIGGIQAAGEAQKNSFTTGFHIGGFAELLISDKFSVQAELLYSKQGSSLESNDVETQDNTFGKLVTTSLTKTELKTAYLNIPILAKYYVTEKLFVVAGPQFGLLLSATSGSTGTGTTVFTFNGTSTTSTRDTNSPDRDTKSTFNSLNIAVGLGGGYFITENIFVEARYNLGLSNDGKSATIPFLGTIEPVYKTSAIQVSLGYKF